MNKKKISHLLSGFLLSLGFLSVKAQTVDDAIMMSKKQWCNGFTYMHSSWKNYWEGTTKRDNKNLLAIHTFHDRHRLKFQGIHF